MPNTCVIGLQWGDEAKGKLVDLLTEQHDIVVRFQGGANAGHTVVADGQTYKLSLIPSGVLRSEVKCVIAGGVVLNPATVLEEIDSLRKRGVRVDENLLLSDRAHVIFPWHMAEDRQLDQDTSSGEHIGTTQRGIGPCYRDKVGRSYAIRLGDLYRDDFVKHVEFVATAKKRLLSTGGEVPPNGWADASQIAKQYGDFAERLKPMVGDATAFLLDALEGGKRVLFEGAQGALLDIDHGTFPYVTSSNSSGVGVTSGAGIPAKWIHKVIGVIKAYSTRVGGGPFPTEQDNEIGRHLQERGREYGTVTGRPRRCGWFDAVATRYTARLSGADVVTVTLLDVLSGLEELQICTAYELDGRQTRDFPSHVDDLRRAVPVYEKLPGWSEDISGVRQWDELPSNAQKYVRRIAELLERPAEIVSVGPDRAQTIHING